MNNLLILVLQTLYVITIISVVIVIISENRDPVKTVSWVLILAFLPVIGLVWYLFFGQDITKEHVISKRMYSKLKKRPLDEIGATEEFVYPQEHESLIRLLKNLDYTPLLGGNQVTLFTRGEDKFEALLADIARAKEHIHIDYYVFLDDQIGTRIKDALVKKSYEGVEVRIIYDSFGSRKAKKSFFEEMRKAGIEAEPFLKLALPVITSRINYRNHRKVVVIDGRVGYIGGMNIADRYIEGFDWGPWRDTHARIEGKGVQGLQSIFLIDWYFVSQTLITSRKYFPKLDNYGDVLMQTVNSGPLKEEREIVHGILQAIYEAKKSIFIQTPYFIPPEPMTEALQAAAIRGVDVRIMISKRSDVPLVQMASRSFIKRILQAGVKVYLYEKGFLHSKLMMFDDSLTLLGSVNFDSRSFEHNFEVEAFAYDEALASQAKEIFVEDQRYSQSVSLKEWMKRPKIKRFLES
ncbi:MAG TPA: cardiolipin synthase, partial [Porphyromonadaceae bacterium]|nr:cardiolipin synthase [Porphyromonadaceae bacterium]HBL32825.1 cardiolipin synthase [Porphyromonadaceae bacterium]